MSHQETADGLTSASNTVVDVAKATDFDALLEEESASPRRLTVLSEVIHGTRGDCLCCLSRQDASTLTSQLTTHYHSFPEVVVDYRLPPPLDMLHMEPLSNCSLSTVPALDRLLQVLRDKRERPAVFLLRTRQDAEGDDQQGGATQSQSLGCQYHMGSYLRGASTFYGMAASAAQVVCAGEGRLHNITVVGLETFQLDGVYTGNTSHAASLSAFTDEQKEMIRMMARLMEDETMEDWDESTRGEAVLKHLSFLTHAEFDSTEQGKFVKSHLDFMNQRSA